LASSKLAIGANCKLSKEESSKQAWRSFDFTLLTGVEIAILEGLGFFVLLFAHQKVSKEIKL